MKNLHLLQGGPNDLQIRAAKYIREALGRSAQFNMKDGVLRYRDGISSRWTEVSPGNEERWGSYDVTTDPQALLPNLTFVESET